MSPTRKGYQADVDGRFWAEPLDRLLARLETSPEGLSEAEAVRRLQHYGYNRLEPRRRAGVLRLLLSQFRNPIVLLLIFAAGLSLFLGEAVDATIILIIVVVSGLLGFWQEKGAADAIDQLLAVVRVHTTVLRNRSEREVPLEEAVPGDVVVLSAGNSVPADCRILDSRDLHVDEATLTGETYPAEKEAGELPADAPLALAVGLTPQLLPAITSVTLSHGARRMAQEKVIVRRLASIENFGSMDVLCSDKTGTITEGRVRLHAALDLEGEESERVFLHAYLNASFETGYLNPIDEAIRTRGKADISGYEKIDGVPYDFVRKRLSILVSRGEGVLVVTKGALENVLSVCSTAELPDGTLVDLAEMEPRSGDGSRS